MSEDNKIRAFDDDGNITPEWKEWQERYRNRYLQIPSKGKRMFSSVTGKEVFPPGRGGYGRD